MMVAGSLYGPAPAGPMPRTRTQIRAPEVKPRSAHFDLVTLGCGVKRQDFAGRSINGRSGRDVGAEQVAQVIYGAATDGTDQLRYLAGDDRRGFIKACQEMSDPDYIRFMRSQFRPKT